MAQKSAENRSDRQSARALGPESSVDELDEQLLWQLYTDADVTNAALAEAVHVSPSTTLSRVRALRERGILGASHAEVDYAALGLPLQAVVSIRLRAQARTAIRSYADRLIAMPNVLNVFFLGGQIDFLVHVVVTSTEQLRDFVSYKISQDPVVASTETQIVFEHLSAHAGRSGAEGFDELRDPMA